MFDDSPSCWNRKRDILDIPNKTEQTETETRFSNINSKCQRNLYIIFSETEIIQNLESNSVLHSVVNSNFDRFRLFIWKKDSMIIKSLDLTI